MIVWLPRKLREDFVREHPIQAVLFCLCGLAFAAFAVWVAIWG